MPHIAVSSFFIDAPGSQKAVGIFDVIDETAISGNITAELAVSQLIVGFGDMNSEGLRDVVREAVLGFCKTNRSSMSEEEKERKIKELNEKNEASLGVAYSRKCNICFAPNPEARAVLTACGHVACMGCVLTLEKNGKLSCPFCRKSSSYVKLHEDIVEEMEEKEDENMEIENEEDKGPEQISEPQTASPLSVNADNSPPSSRPTPDVAIHSPTTLRHLPHAHNFHGNSQPTHSPPHNPNSAPPRHTVVVGNLPLETTEADLRIWFSQLEQNTTIQILENCIAGSSENVALLDFEDEEAAWNVYLSFNGVEFNGRFLRICAPFISQ